MKKLNFNFIALFAFAAFLFTSCGEDPIIPEVGGDKDPTISLLAKDGFISDNAILEVGQIFKVSVSVSAGSEDLRTLTVFEDGVRMPLDRISLNANPALILGADKQGATYDIEITPDASITDEGVYTYAFEVEDEDGNTATTSVVINTEIPFTDIEMDLTGVLLNQAGPAGRGGLDLDTGEGTGSNDAAAEIQDEGIDTDIVAADNWRQQISGANDAVMLSVDLDKVVEGLTFAEVIYKEQIEDAFNAGVELDGDDDVVNGTDGTRDEKVSQPVNVGDVFVVRRNDRTYLITCTGINITAGDNNDSYEFSIKY